MYEDILVAILAKDKAHVLPFYLGCLLKQTYPKKRLHLYIRTNDNIDNTVDILNEFVNEHGYKYGSIYFNSASIQPDLMNYGQHQWNSDRFKILGKIRQDSVEYARRIFAHYFVADCDNFVGPTTIEDLYTVRGLGVVSPMLKSTSLYSNYHVDVDENGYFKDHPQYLQIYNNEIKGCTEVKVIHCTYFIHNKHLASVVYDDSSYRYEYVIFSDSMRKRNIPQYIDNRKLYGFLTFVESSETFEKECEDGWKITFPTFF